MNDDPFHGLEWLEKLALLQRIACGIKRAVSDFQGANSERIINERIQRLQLLMISLRPQPPSDDDPEEGDF